MGLNVTPISITGHYWSLWWGPEVAFQGLWRIVILKARLKGTHLWFGNSLLSLVSLTFFCSDSVWKMKKHNIKTYQPVEICSPWAQLATPVIGACIALRNIMWRIQQQCPITVRCLFSRSGFHFCAVVIWVTSQCFAHGLISLCSHELTRFYLQTCVWTSSSSHTSAITPTGTSTNKTFIFILRFSLILHYKIFFFPSSLDHYQTYIRYTVMPN